MGERCLKRNKHSRALTFMLPLAPSSRADDDRVRGKPEPVPAGAGQTAECRYTGGPRLSKAKTAERSPERKAV